MPNEPDPREAMPRIEDDQTTTKAFWPVSQDHGIIIALIVGYAIGIGIVYQVSYWRTFGINILVYLTFLEIFLFSLYSLLAFFAVLLLVAIFGEVYHLFTMYMLRRVAALRQPRTDIPSGKSGIVKILKTIDRRIWNFANRYDTGSFFSMAVIVSFLSGFTVRSDASSSPTVWVALVLMVVSWIMIRNSDPFSFWVRSRGLRRYLYFALAVFPFAAIMAGKFDASKIKDAKEYYLLETLNSPISVDLSEGWKFIGSTRQQYFFTDHDNQKILYISTAEVSSLSLKAVISDEVGEEHAGDSVVKSNTVPTSEVVDTETRD